MARVTEIQEDIGQKGFAIILEMVADKNMQTDLELAGPKCRLIIIGSHGTVSITPELILAKEVTVSGVKLSDSTPDQWKEMSELLQQKLHKGILRPKLNKEYARADVVKVSFWAKGGNGFGRRLAWHALVEPHSLWFDFWTD